MHPSAQKRQPTPPRPQVLHFDSLQRSVAHFPPPAADSPVGRDLQHASQPRGLIARRLRYIARAAYFIAVHRSLRHWRWALAHEGTTWN